MYALYEEHNITRRKRRDVFFMWIKIVTKLEAELNEIQRKQLNVIIQ